MQSPEHGIADDSNDNSMNAKVYISNINKSVSLFLLRLTRTLLKRNSNSLALSDHAFSKKRLMMSPILLSSMKSLTMLLEPYRSNSHFI
jgi:hypothetical protein